MNAPPAAPPTAQSGKRSRVKRAGHRDRSAEWLAWAQGGFFFVTGLWPLLHLPSFLTVTGPKTDLWLVQTIGALLAVSGAALMLAAWRHRVSAEWIFLGAALAAVLATVDIVFVNRAVIPPIYLADALVESLIVVAWLVIAGRKRPRHH